MARRSGASSGIVGDGIAARQHAKAHALAKQNEEHEIEERQHPMAAA
eukprot:COSAG01_NODE_39842_length_471_cov_1.198925_1_plen_46_part_01